ncbi:MAG: hypothetical protein R3F62_24960 [Planctomycetota bacterium]
MRHLCPWIAALAFGFAIAGCGGGGGGGSSSATQAPISSGSGGGTTSGSSSAPGSSTPTLEPNGSLGFELRAAIARDFAPQLRYNAYYDDGNGSRQNRNEDFFPIGVRAFLAELHAQQVRVVVDQSTGLTPALVSLEPTTDQAQFGAQALEPYPKFMAGAQPGTAPLYTHVYPDDATRQLDVQLAGTLEVFCEFFVFYAHDRAEATVLGIIPTGGNNDRFGHRGDWERVHVRARVAFGPGGAYLGGEVLQGFFSGHGKLFLAERPELETVNAQGQEDPQGTHTVVYVSNGKHAAFPQAGEWKDANYPAWVADYTDFFRGNGVWIDGWSVPLFDLEEPARAPDEFASAEFFALQSAAVTLTDWTQYTGAWGPDDYRIPLVGIQIAASPSGPKLKSEYGRFGGTTELWLDAKQHSRLKVYRDLGTVVPRANPLPYPN